MAIPCYNTLFTLHYTALHHTAPHYTTPHHTTLHHTTLHYTTPHHTTLHHTTPHHTTLHYTTPHYTTLHHTTLHHTTLHYTTLHYTTLHYTTLHYTTPHYTTPHYTTPHHTTLHHSIASCYIPSLCHVPEDASDEVNVSLGQETTCQRDNLSVCRFSLHVMIASSQVAIATDSVPLPEVTLAILYLLRLPCRPIAMTYPSCYQRPQGPGEEEKLIEVEEASQSHWQHQATSQHPLRFKCSDIDLFYCCYVSSQVQHLTVQVGQDMQQCYTLR